MKYETNVSMHNQIMSRFKQEKEKSLDSILDRLPDNEGWCMSLCERANETTWELQYVEDDMESSGFSEDADAWEYIWAKAKSEVHSPYGDLLRWIHRYSLVEFQFITSHVLDLPKYFKITSLRWLYLDKI